MAVILRNRRNYRKHTNPNPVQRWLLGRFHARVTELASVALGRALPSSPPPLPHSPIVLDVGCGEGFASAYLQEHLAGIHLVGVDVDYQVVGTACPHGLFAGGDALALPFADRSFDLVLCLEVLEHLERPWEALAELARVSRGGVLVSVPHQPFFSLANLLRGKNLARWGDDPEHRQRWTPFRFLSLLAERGTVDCVAYAFPWVIVLVREERV